MSRIIILSLALTLVLSGCRPPWEPCDVEQETTVSLTFQASNPETHNAYAALSVLAIQNAKTDTVRAFSRVPSSLDLSNSLSLGKPDSVRIRVLRGDSVLFERLYDTHDYSQSHRISLSSDTTQCLSDSSEVFELPGGHPLAVCFSSHVAACFD